MFGIVLWIVNVIVWMHVKVEAKFCCVNMYIVVVSRSMKIWLRTLFKHSGEIILQLPTPNPLRTQASEYKVKTDEKERTNCGKKTKNSRKF